MLPTHSTLSAEMPNMPDPRSLHASSLKVVVGRLATPLFLAVCRQCPAKACRHSKSDLAVISTADSVKEGRVAHLVPLNINSACGFLPSVAGSGGRWQGSQIDPRTSLGIGCTK